LGKAASEIRNRLGESLSTVQKFDTPLEQATTPSLEALQAYSLAGKASERENGDAATLGDPMTSLLFSRFVIPLGTKIPDREWGQVRIYRRGLL
jgi:hypothetical protein